VAAAKRLFKNRTAGGMTRTPGRVLALLTGAVDRHNSVTGPSWQGDTRRGEAPLLVRRSRSREKWKGRVAKLPRGGLLHEAPVERLGQIHLGVPELVVKRQEHIGGRLHAGGGNDAGQRIDRLVGFDCGDVELLVAEEVVLRHRRSDLLGARLLQPLERL